ncbi:MAG TPA: hypothetical protein VMC07_02650, partial [Candidatus Omnitrophota bacterium]|nr:hypothetical protein [Candidatus Omnitrophota bacterium]
MRNNLILFLCLSMIMLLIIPMSSAVLLSDQGTDVKNSTGSLLPYGNLTILIYDASSGGNLLFNSTIQNAIVNGSWNLMIDPNLQYNQHYWKDYQINGEDLTFDGNDRIEFQSPLGIINNASYFNFSLIGSCPAGNAIGVVNQNGSVQCVSVTSADLTNYALKNQSETFAGNISTSNYGLFGWLGSLANRITKLFVQDIDASGNITANYFIGNGSQLTGISATETLWNNNYSNFSTVYGYAVNSTSSSGISWANAVNGTLALSAYISNSTFYPYSTNPSNFFNSTYYGNIGNYTANANNYWNSTNYGGIGNFTSNYSVSGPYINWSTLNNGSFTGSGITWANAMNGTILTISNGSWVNLEVGNFTSNYS